MSYRVITCGECGAQLDESPWQCNEHPDAGTDEVPAVPLTLAERFAGFVETMIARGWVDRAGYEEAQAALEDARRGRVAAVQEVRGVDPRELRETIRRSAELAGFRVFETEDQP